MTSQNLEGLINVEVEITQLLFSFEKLFTNIINQVNKFGSEQIESTPRNSQVKQNEKQAPNVMKEFLQQKVEWIKLLENFYSQYTEKFNEYKEKKFTFNRLCQEEYLKTKRFNFSCNLNSNLNLKLNQHINFYSWDQVLQRFEEIIPTPSNIQSQYKQNYENIHAATKQLEIQILHLEQQKVLREELQQQQNLLIQQQQQLQQEQLQKQKELAEKQIQDAEKAQREFEEAEKQKLQQTEQTEQTEQVQEIVNQPDEKVAQENHEESDSGISETNEIFYWCQKCQTNIETNGIQLNCQHFFHSECLKELIQYQISNAYIKCDCNTQLSSKLIINFLKQISKMENNNYLEIQYLNFQAQNIINKFNYQKCNCGFVYLTPGEKCENINLEKCVQCEE